METNAIGTTLEERLATLTEVGTDILKRWAVTADRHAAAVSELEEHVRELSAAGTQLHEDAADRLRDLERIVQQEWDSLRQLHEAPVRNLVEQAASLTQVCVATANSAQSGFDRAEARLAALEAEFHRTTAGLTREIHGLVLELRSVSSSGHLQLPGQATSTPSWPLEGVTRLHNQLRETDGTPTAVLALPEPSTPHPPATVAPPRRSVTAAVIVAAAVFVAAAAAFAWRIERDVRASAAQASDSQRQVRIAADAAARAAAEQQQAAAQELASARQLATRAQLIGAVLAAPDLIRYALVGGDALPAATGQMLWSRSRGFVFSASGLPAPPRDSTYQVWLITRAGAISAGTIAPDPAGGATLADTPDAPPPVIGAMVTVEPKGGSTAPSGDPVLVRLPRSPAT